MEFVFFILVLMMIGSLIMLIRNNQVHKTRVEILSEISALAQKDIAEDRPFLWRYDEFGKVEYNTQVWQFWTDIRSHWNPKMWEEKL